jgi:hypothetical protein
MPLCVTCSRPLTGFLRPRKYHPRCRPNVKPEPDRPRMKQIVAQLLITERRLARKAA